MKNVKNYLACLAVFALLFTSCSKDDGSDLLEGDQELIQLTFGSLLNDMKNDQTKQATPGECREGMPAYVMVGITDEDENYVGGGTSDVNLIEVGLKNNNGSWETTYSEDLALPAGDYQLEYFIVYDTNDEVLWVAPREEGTFGDYVPHALPMDIDLRAGTKPYIMVDVLCYVSRSEEAYGYLFFDINLNRVENSYCIFVNYCDDGTGREYPAYFEVEIWSDEFDGTPVSLTANRNIISMAGDYPSASVLCFALPDLGDETYYARVTVLNHDFLPYVADPEADFFEFEITQEDIDAQKLQTPAYEHIRFNCQPPFGDEPCQPGSMTGDTNGDCIVDCKDTNSCQGGDCVVPGDTNGDCIVDCQDTDTCEPGECQVAGDTNGDCIVDCRDTNTCASDDGCGDSAYMFGNIELTDLNLQGGQNWGWGLLSGQPDNFASAYYNELDDQWEFPFYAGAGQNMVNKAWEAGTVIVTIEDGLLNVEIDLHDGVSMTDSHIWFSDDGEWPGQRAPGKFDLNKSSFVVDGTGPYSLIVHGGGLCHEDFNNE